MPYPIDLGQDLVLYFSDKLILDVECRLCGAMTVVNHRADKYDDGLAVCKACNRRSNYITFEDSMSISSIIQRFSTNPLPVKFVSFNVEQQQFILELEV